MAFQKTADIEVIASALFEDGSLRKVARADDTSESASSAPSASSLPKAASYFLDGSRSIDVQGILREHAPKYSLSASPSDYVFEAIRANTTNVPNDNHDAFHRDELLSFDRRARKAVYQTYTGKPHHVDHRTDNPHRARGIILDAAYNDSAPALETCPAKGCGNATADRANRDPSGIHCRKCGSTVKDEFVEILVAVDKSKDPRFAEMVRTGLLNSGSMGCNCASTVCNVCDHVAHTVQEFCGHIRAGSKGTYWVRQPGKSAASDDGWKRLDKKDVIELAKRAGLTLEAGLPNFCSMNLGGVEVRKAYERCQGVEFEEYSRVHRPADPKARQVEILKAASQESLTLEQETEQLVLRARLQELERIAMSKRSKSAQLDLESDVKVRPPDGAVISVPDGVQVEVEDAMSADPMNQDPNALGDPNALPFDPNAPGAMPGAPGSPGMGPPGDIENLDDPQQQPTQSPAEFGMEELTPGASLDVSAEGEESEEDMENKEAGAPKSAQKFASVYGDFAVEVFSNHAIVRGPSAAGQLGAELLAIKSAKKLATNEAKTAFGREINDALLTGGLTRTALKFSASFLPKFAQVTDAAVFDMQEGRIDPQSAIADAGTDMQMDRPAAEDSATEGAADDMQGDKPAAPDTTYSSREDDMEETKPATNTQMESPEFDHTETLKPSKDSLEGSENDMQLKASRDASRSAALTAKATEERMRKLYASRLEAAKKAFEEEKAALESSLRERFARALKLVARRHLLNLEESPLKTTMLDSLTVARPVGKEASGEPLVFSPLDDDLALHLVESAWHQAALEEVDRLVVRAAEIMSYSDEYLMNAESDLGKQAAVIPQVSASSALEPQDEMTRIASATRSRLANGNLTLTPSPADSNVGGDHTTNIRSALGHTKLSRLLNEGFRPS